MQWRELEIETNTLIIAISIEFRVCTTSVRNMMTYHSFSCIHWISLHCTVLWEFSRLMGLRRTPVLDGRCLSSGKWNMLKDKLQLLCPRRRLRTLPCSYLHSFRFYEFPPLVRGSRNTTVSVSTIKDAQNADQLLVWRRRLMFILLSDCQKDNCKIGTTWVSCKVALMINSMQSRYMKVSKGCHITIRNQQ